MSMLSQAHKLSLRLADHHRVMLNDQNPKEQFREVLIDCLSRFSNLSSVQSVSSYSLLSLTYPPRTHEEQDRWFLCAYRMQRKTLMQGIYVPTKQEYASWIVCSLLAVVANMPAQIRSINLPLNPWRLWLTNRHLNASSSYWRCIRQRLGPSLRYVTHLTLDITPDHKDQELINQKGGPWNGHDPETNPDTDMQIVHFLNSAAALEGLKLLTDKFPGTDFIGIKSDVDATILNLNGVFDKMNLPRLGTVYISKLEVSGHAMVKWLKAHSQSLKEVKFDQARIHASFDDRSLASWKMALQSVASEMSLDRVDLGQVSDLFMEYVATFYKTKRNQNMKDQWQENIEEYSI